MPNFWVPISDHNLKINEHVDDLVITPIPKRFFYRQLFFIHCCVSNRNPHRFYNCLHFSNHFSASSINSNPRGIWGLQYTNMCSIFITFLQCSNKIWFGAIYSWIYRRRGFSHGQISTVFVRTGIHSGQLFSLWYWFSTELNFFLAISRWEKFSQYSHLSNRLCVRFCWSLI